jgi:hypothetical protein
MRHKTGMVNTKTENSVSTVSIVSARVAISIWALWHNRRGASRCWVGKPPQRSSQLRDASSVIALNITRLHQMLADWPGLHVGPRMPRIRGA